MLKGMEIVMQEMNKRIVLAKRPLGLPKLSDFALVEAPLPQPGEGEFLVRAHYLSLDPYQRGRMNDGPSYAAPVGIGEVIAGGVVGEITLSNHPDYATGETVVGNLGWQQCAVSNGQGIRKVDPGLAPVSTALGILGMPGMTAYFGLLEIGKPRPDGTLLVTSAAGAVGSAVGQIGKLKGCRIIGVAGSDSKVDYLVSELGFDDAFNYKTVKNYYRKLRTLCPKGIDVYFDNVGGAVTDAVFRLINVGARIVICGQISQYNLTRPEMGPRFLWQLIVKRARIEGFLVGDFAERYEAGLQEMASWLADERIRYREDIAEGIEQAPEAFIGLLQGRNHGKQLIKIGSRR